MKLGNHRWKDLYPQMLRGTRQFRGSDISSFARKRIAMITGGRRDEIKGEGGKKEKNATKRDIVPLLSKPAECGPNFSAALPIYILYIKIGGFTLLDMRVFRVYVYIFLQRECTPSNVSLARPEERGKTVAPYFPPFCFSPIPSFTLFPGIPLFFSLLRSLHPLFLRAFCRWWMEKVKTWPVSERMRKVCVCVWRVRAMIGEFSGKAPPNCEFRACFSPLSCLLWLVNGLVLFIHHSPSFVIRLSQRYWTKFLKSDGDFVNFQLYPCCGYQRGWQTPSNQSFLAE